MNRKALVVATTGVLLLVGCSSATADQPPPSPIAVDTDRYDIYAHTVPVDGRQIPCIVTVSNGSGYGNPVALSCDWSAR